MLRSGFWVPIIVSIVLTPIALFLGLASAGAGHGNYFVAKLLFPYTMLSTAFLDEINLFFLILALIQFPLYGCAVAFGVVTERVRIVYLLLVALHVLAILICFSVVSENFS